MSSRQVTVVDAGVGNLGNVRRALEALGAEVALSRDPERIRRSRCLVLPGVGAFRPPREALRGAPEQALREALEAGAWLLGICVGYQLLFEAGEEHGTTEGLGWLPGRVTRLAAEPRSEPPLPLPHIGWNRLEPRAEHPLLAGIAPGSFVYFVHSYAPENVPADALLASTFYGRPFAAVAARGRVAGTQFHPEKSDRVGLKLLENFLEMAHGSAASA
ncbi:MAG: imidazole glycerol phosphate synthase subunit HisH [Thermoanaerobaculia bacterium]